MGRRLARVGALVALAVAVSGCQATLSAGVEVRADGSGVVRAAVGFDDAALTEAGGEEVLASSLRSDDLRGAGWDVTGPEREDDGLTWVRASRGFDDPGEAEEVAAQLSGPAGPFRDFHLTRDRSLLRTDTSFEGLIDLEGGLAGLSDSELDAALGGTSHGLDAEGLRGRFGDDLAGSVRVEAWASLPGDVGAEGARVSGSRAVWVGSFGEVIELRADASLRRLTPLLYGSAVLVVVSVGLAVVVLRRRAVRRRRKAIRR